MRAHHVMLGAVLVAVTGVASCSWSDDGQSDQAAITDSATEQPIEAAAPTDSETSDDTPRELSAEEAAEVLKMLEAEGPGLIARAYDDCEIAALKEPANVQEKLADCFVGPALKTGVTRLQDSMKEGTFTRKGTYKFAFDDFSVINSHEYSVGACVTGEDVDYFLNGDLKYDGANYESYRQIFYLTPTPDGLRVAKMADDPKAGDKPCWKSE